MDDFLKQRLLGAIAIIGLAVIFIPVILDKDDTSNVVETMQIPPRPEKLQNVDIQQVLEEKQTEVAKQDVQLPEPLKIQPEEISQLSFDEAQKEISSTNQTNEIADLWVVQLGSFSQQDNAVALRDRLISNYPDLYIEQIKVPTGTNYRLRLGDFADRQAAISKRREIQEQFDLPGVVMAKE